MTSGPFGRGRNAIGGCVSGSNTVISPFSSQARKARWWSGSRAIPWFPASSNWIPADDLIGGGVNHSEDVLILEVDVHLVCYRVVLRHACFAIEVQSADNFVFLYIDDSLRLASFI